MFLIFFFNDTATTEIYTLSLHDALPIFAGAAHVRAGELLGRADRVRDQPAAQDPGLRSGSEPVDVAPLGGVADDHVVDLRDPRRSEEHTSELQSRQYLVCRLLLEKKNRT